MSYRDKSFAARLQEAANTIDELNGPRRAAGAFGSSTAWSASELRIWANNLEAEVERRERLAEALRADIAAVDRRERLRVAMTSDIESGVPRVTDHAMLADHLIDQGWTKRFRGSARPTHTTDTVLHDL